MRMTRFEAGDLLRMPVEAGRYDLIMCRNTVIYFTEEVRDALHARLATALAPGGYLVVGTSERVADPRGLGLTSPFHFIYRKNES
jgi:chemotaxis protein methyltransferase CheR